MHAILLSLHSLLRWLVIVPLAAACFRAAYGWAANSRFRSFDNALRHWTATLLHIQLIVGMLLYFKSPMVQYHLKVEGTDTVASFFTIIHPVAMFIAIVLVTIGSALARRKAGDREKFATMAIFFSIGLLIILFIIPWPFSFVQRPYYRMF